MSGARSRAKIIGFAEETWRLLKHGLSSARLANPFLVFLNAHPSNLFYYDSFVEGSDKRVYWKNLLRCLGLPLLALKRQEDKLYCTAKPQSGVEVLFLSHFVKEAQLQGDGDAYFSDLPQQLADRGISSFTAMINHTWTSPSRLRDVFKQQSALGNVGVLPRLCDFGRECLFLFALWRDRRALLSATSGKGRTELSEQRLMTAAADHSISTRSLNTMRIGWQVDHLIRELRPKAIITTYEGHGWERLVFKTACDFDPTIRRIGFHHTVLFPEQFSIRKMLPSEWMPDVILATGRPNLAWFQAQAEIGSLDKDVMGSPRRPKATGSGTGTTALPLVDSKKTCVLVVPEGLVSESVTLFMTAVHTAVQDANHKFVLRPHPVVSQQMIVEACSALRTLPGNVSWSAQPLEKDFQCSTHVLYRGSTVVIEAVLNGLRPVYLASAHDPFDIDPLAPVNDYKAVVKDARELRELLRAPSPQTETSKLEVEAFCDTYFMPLDVEKLIEHVSRKCD